MLHKLIKSRNVALIQMRARAFSKVYPSALEATKDISTGASLCVGGFGLVGIPANLINALVQHRPNGLTVASNNCGVDDWGLGLMLNQK
jgi:3-oxoacid CoA-transferase subunit A